MENCDMCGTKIIDSKCSCGEWKSNEEMKDNPLKNAIENFNEMKRFSLTMDAPHLGCAAVFFRGDYNDTQAVLDFIYKLKNRPHYG